jgi:AcrR family transcriptional regulator
VTTTRRYDSTLRRERATQTRDRIVDAGAELVHGLSSWDWRTITIRAVAERAGVHERTVYRHFATEDILRSAVVARLEQEAGLSPDDLTVEGLAEHVTKLFRYLATFASSTEPRLDPSLAAEDVRRREGLLAAVNEVVPDWDDHDQAVVAALVDVLTGVPAYRRFVSGWNLDPADAAGAVNWLLALLRREVEADRAPSAR